MPRRDWNFRVQDILDAVSAVQNYTAGMTLDAFTHDRRTVDAVVRIPTSGIRLHRGHSQHE